MHKAQRRTFIITLVLAGITILGMITLIFSYNSFSEAAYDLVILIVSAASIIAAVYAQLASSRESARMSKMIHNLNAIDKNLDSDIHSDEIVVKKLNRILSQNQMIMDKLGISDERPPIPDPPKAELDKAQPKPAVKIAKPADKDTPVKA